MFRFYRRLQEKNVRNVRRHADMPQSLLSLVTTFFIALTSFFLLLIAGDNINITVMENPELHLLLIFFPLIMVALFFALALLDYLIDIQVKYVTRGKKSMNKIIFNYLFPAVHIDGSDKTYKAKINGFNCNNFVVPPTFILYTLVLIYAFPVLLWIVLFGVVWFGILKVARMIFSVSERFAEHKTDLNAHKNV